MVDVRSFDCAAEILKHLGVRSVHLLSNNPRKKDELVKAGMPVTRVVPVVPPHNHENVRYLNTRAGMRWCRASRARWAWGAFTGWAVLSR
ncbi:hypothetical protein [Zoogloea sp.]|uniref:hypothetical protein n=1 Tax=Zoogloea sp. TaxID=49181 RepID=UPI002639CE12|nr:hypothetical protein [Zoogloea sp.]MDD3352713.1 hypothetical protein [Zoogloea sp.]